MLDYDEKTQCYLVQKVNKSGRIINKETGEAVVNGGIQPDGREFVVYTFIFGTNLHMKSGILHFPILLKCYWALQLLHNPGI